MDIVTAGPRDQRVIYSALRQNHSYGNALALPGLRGPKEIEGFHYITGRLAGQSPNYAIRIDENKDDIYIHVIYEIQYEESDGKTVRNHMGEVLARVAHLMCRYNDLRDRFVGIIAKEDTSILETVKNVFQGQEVFSDDVTDRPGFKYYSVYIPYDEDAIYSRFVEAGLEFYEGSPDTDEFRAMEAKAVADTRAKTSFPIAEIVSNELASARFAAAASYWFYKGVYGTSFAPAILAAGAAYAGSATGTAYGVSAVDTAPMMVAVIAPDVVRKVADFVGVLTMTAFGEVITSKIALENAINNQVAGATIATLQSDWATQRWSTLLVKHFNVVATGFTGLIAAGTGGAMATAALNAVGSVLSRHVKPGRSVADGVVQVAGDTVGHRVKEVAKRSVGAVLKYSLVAAAATTLATSSDYVNNNHLAPAKNMLSYGTTYVNTMFDRNRFVVTDPATNRTLFGSTQERSFSQAVDAWMAGVPPTLAGNKFASLNPDGKTVKEFDEIDQLVLSALVDNPSASTIFVMTPAGEADILHVTDVVYPNGMVVHTVPSVVSFMDQMAMYYSRDIIHDLTRLVNDLQAKWRHFDAVVKVQSATTGMSMRLNDEKLDVGKLDTLTSRQLRNVVVTNQYDHVDRLSQFNASSTPVDVVQCVSEIDNAIFKPYLDVDIRKVCEYGFNQDSAVNLVEALYADVAHTHAVEKGRFAHALSEKTAWERFSHDVRSAIQKLTHSPVLVVEEPSWGGTILKFVAALDPTPFRRDPVAPSSDLNTAWHSMLNYARAQLDVDNDVDRIFKTSCANACEYAIQLIEMTDKIATNETTKEVFVKSLQDLATKDPLAPAFFYDPDPYVNGLWLAYGRDPTNDDNLNRLAEAFMMKQHAYTTELRGRITRDQISDSVMFNLVMHGYVDESKDSITSTLLKIIQNKNSRLRKMRWVFRLQDPKKPSGVVVDYDDRDDYVVTLQSAKLTRSTLAQLINVGVTLIGPINREPASVNRLIETFRSLVPPDIRRKFPDTGAWTHVSVSLEGRDYTGYTDIANLFDTVTFGQFANMSIKFAENAIVDDTDTVVTSMVEERNKLETCTDDATRQAIWRNVVKIVNDNPWTPARVKRLYASTNKKNARHDPVPSTGDAIVDFLINAEPYIIVLCALAYAWKQDTRTKLWVTIIGCMAAAFIAYHNADAKNGPPLQMTKMAYAHIAKLVTLFSTIHGYHTRPVTLRTKHLVTNPGIVV